VGLPELISPSRVAGEGIVRGADNPPDISFRSSVRIHSVSCLWLGVLAAAAAMCSAAATPAKLLQTPGTQATRLPAACTINHNARHNHSQTHRGCGAASL